MTWTDFDKVFAKDRAIKIEIKLFKSPFVEKRRSYLLANRVFAR
jgi:hypothetical protein